MKKWIIRFVVIGILIITGGLGWLYQYGGLRYYLKATNYINSLEGEEWEEAYKSFYIGEGDTSLYPGILAGVWLNKVWVWGQKGLKYFNIHNTVYSYTDGCSVRGQIEREREIITDFNIWKSKVRQGDVVLAKLAKETNGETLNYLAEVYSFNWWFFMGQDMETECAK